MIKIDEHLDFEHSIIESNATQLDSLELPLSRRVFVLMGLGAFIFASIAVVKFLDLSIQKNDFYTARAEMNVEQPITIPAKRGVIYDRYGVKLASDEAARRIVLNAGLIKRADIDLEETLGSLVDILDMEITDLEEMVYQADLEKSALITLIHDASEDQIKAILDLDNNALEIHDDYRRDYPGGPAFAHVLGYTGLAELRDSHGKTGLEEYYNELLIGEDGVRLIYRDAQNNILDEKLLSHPKNGNDLHTTIDAELQKYFYTVLQNKLWELDRTTAVGIAINPQNGEVLALLNIPSYDNNIFTKSDNISKRYSLLSDPKLPLFNRAVSGIYNPASTIKPLVGVAALSEGVIDSSKEIYSKGYIEIPNPYFPDQPSRFLDWKPHGWVNLRSALARSSNVYFYAVGGGYEDVKGLGVDKLKEYWKKFGFGVKTGIDLNSENVGFLPDPEEKFDRTGIEWRLGDTYNVSIGQGDLLVTPIQLINYIAAIANGGKLYKPHLHNDQNGNYFNVIGDLSYLKELIKEVQEGMRDAVTEWYGTSYILNDLPISIGAKTGSAQVANNTKTNAFFVGYEPFENPEILILILIENAREGSLNAVPVGKDVLGWYYNNRLATQ
ncbi:hypothetical protein GW950_01430 [Candidatus Wolfebacteria bacterium]|nr:hypothetical protein [Candidatus Wolfebacteria bacterium]